ncbi:MAG: hypothetical protein ACE5JQ_09295 [Candidatus Methylomirabilales bacterium]
MIFEHLKAKGLVEVVAPDLHRANRLLARAHKDLKTAQAMVGTDPEWSYLIAAHGILRAGRALALAEGLRPRGRDQARTLLQMAGYLVGEDQASMVNDLDQVRKKGQQFLESADRPISHYELEATLNVAERLVGVVTKHVYTKELQMPLL